MGGSAFKQHGLSTPRMPPAVYHFALRHIEDKLSMLFPKVAHCIEAPGKKDYGDLDVLVLPEPEKPVPSLEAVAKLLNAKRSYHEPSNGVSAFAIPWPDSASLAPSATKNGSWTEHGSIKPPQTQNPDLYIQLDLQVCTSHQEFTWRQFIHGHADLISIISAMVRHKGLTITDQALYLRIQSIETHNKKLARVELSRDPKLVLQYLGLDEDKFWHPFWSLDELMDYMATCRFHNPARINGVDATMENREETVRATLNTYDNQRLICRPMFRYWFQTYLPTHTTHAPGQSAHLTREEIIEDVFAFFGPELKAKYEHQRKQTTTIIQRGQLWSNIRTKILESHPELEENDIHDTLKGLKLEILSAPVAAQTSMTSVQSSYTNDDFSSVIFWALANHAAVLTRYRKWLQDNKIDTLPDTRKSNPFSRSELEVYSPKDDEVVMSMKSNGSSWSQILTVLGKKSKSQLQAHWKLLHGREQKGKEKDEVAPKATLYRAQSIAGMAN